MKDSSDCAVYAIAFTCHVSPLVSRSQLFQAGRKTGDGATDEQILTTIRYFCRDALRFRTDPRTIRTFARENLWGTFIVVTADHVVAVVDGHICGRGCDSDLMRIEKVWKII